jgi:single-strand DNA-binding protein
MSWEVPMINEAHISLSGFVATQPFFRETQAGIPTLSMRVAWTPRRLDRVTGEWIDAETSFASVVCFRKLAENAATCLRKGDPVVVRGRMSVRDYEDRNGVARTGVNIDATSLGHDLSRGVTTFQRRRLQTGPTAMEEYQAAGDGELAADPAGPGDAVADDAALARLIASADADTGTGADTGTEATAGSGPGSSSGSRVGSGSKSRPGSGSRASSESGSAAAGEQGRDGGEVLADGAVSVAAPF